MKRIAIRDVMNDITEKIAQAVVLEKAYVDDAIPKWLLGLNPESVKEYVEYIADRRFERLNLPLMYNTKTPFPWMSEIIDMPKEKNFFETRVTEYQTGGALDW